MRNIIFFFLSILCLQAGAKTIRFANSGNNLSGTGSEALPYLTFAKALGMAVPGDSVLGKGGDFFYEQVYIAPTTKANIYIGSYGTGRATFIGYKTYTSFLGAGTNKYSISDAAFPLVVGVVMKDNRLLEFGSNTATFQPFTSHSGRAWIAGTGLAGDHTGERVVIKLRNWADGIAYVWKQHVDTIFYAYAGLQKPAMVIPYDPFDRYGFRLFNSLNYLTSDYKYHYDSLNRKVTFYSSTPPTSLKVAVLPNAFNCDASGVTFENINIVGYGRWGIIGGGSNNTVKNCGFQFISDAAIYIVDKRAWNISGNTFYDIQSTAIKALNGGVGANAWTINDNAFRRIGASHLHGYNGDPQFIAVYVAGDSLTMYRNTSDSTGYNTFHWDGAAASIKYNKGANSNLLHGDGATFYSYASPNKALVTPAKSEVMYNTSVNSFGSSDGVYSGTWDVTNANGKGANFYFDEHCNNIEVAYNNGANPSWCNLMLHNTHNIDAHDNVFFGQSGSWRALYYRNYATSLSETANNNKFRRNTISIPNYRNAFGPTVLIEYSTESTDASVFPYLDSNSYYSLRPLDTLFCTTYGGTFGYKTFAQWKTFTSGDANSSATLKDSHSFFSNTGAESITPTWNGWNDAGGTPLTGLLAAYSSVIGFNQSGVEPPPPPPVEPAVPRQIIYREIKLAITKNGIRYRIIATQ